MCRDETIRPRAYDNGVVAFHFGTPAAGKGIPPAWIMPIELQVLGRFGQA
jgi:hypothetical protein